MPTYRYRIVGEVEIEAPNIMAAEQAVRSRLLGKRSIRVVGNFSRSVVLPSMKRNERCWVSSRVVDDGKIQRKRKKRHENDKKIKNEKEALGK